MHPVGSSLPSSLQVVVGNSSFSLQLWWEAPSDFSFVELIRRNCVPSEQKVGGRSGGLFTHRQSERMGMHPLSTIGAIESLCCRSKAAGEGAAGFDAKSVTVGLTCCRPRLVGEAIVVSTTISVWGGYNCNGRKWGSWACCLCEGWWGGSWADRGWKRPAVV